jgi:hypothetical protein
MVPYDTSLEFLVIGCYTSHRDDSKTFSINVNSSICRSNPKIEPGVPFPFGVSKITLKEVEVFQIDWDVAKAFEPPFNFPVH